MMRVTAMFRSACSGTSGRPRSAPGSSACSHAGSCGKGRLGDPVSAVEEEVPFLPPLPAHSRHRVPPFFLYGFGMILADFFRLQAPLGKMDGWWVRPMGFFSFCRVSGRFSPFFSLTQKKRRPAGRPRLSKKPFREVRRAAALRAVFRIQRHVRWIRKPCVARFPCAFPRPR